MPIKIVIINGQNHKGSTYHIGKMLADKIGGEREEFFLPKDFGELASRCHDAMKPSWWQRLASRLDLPADVLIRLQVGWFAEKNATTWPMVDAITGALAG